MNDPRRPGFRTRLLAACKYGFAALLLFLVMHSLPWHDEASLAEAGGTRVFAGTLVGDWKSDRVRFELDANVDWATLPADWQSQRTGSRTVELIRGAGLNWRPGVPRVFRSVDPSNLAPAIALLFVSIFLQTTRWWRLLAAIGCATDWLNALRLNLYGLFFNLVVPGLTGGDLVRALLVARDHPERRAAAAISVLIDRLVGLLVLAFLGTVVILLEGDKFAVLRTPLLAALCGGGLAACMYANPALRRAVNFTHWLRRMPMSNSLLQIDEAFLIYSKRPIELLLAALFSICSHSCVVLAIFVLGRAFGDSSLSLMQYVAISSVGNIASALPIAPGGWGVGEAVYRFLFELVGGDGTIGVAVSITFKLLFALIGLCGGVFLLFPNGRRLISGLRQPPMGS